MLLIGVRRRKNQSDSSGSAETLMTAGRFLMKNLIHGMKPMNINAALLRTAFRQPYPAISLVEIGEKIIPPRLVAVATMPIATPRLPVNQLEARYAPGPIPAKVSPTDIIKS